MLLLSPKQSRPPPPHQFAKLILERVYQLLESSDRGGYPGKPKGGGGLVYLWDGRAAQGMGMGER